jgi:hypothetical protein
MILATYLPIYRVIELEIFKTNIEIANPEKIVICIDYYFDKTQDVLYQQFVRELGEADTIKGNWRNRASCLLRLVRYIAESGGDGLIVDSDVLLPQQWREIDKKLNLPFYHLAHEPWRHKRVRKEIVNGVEIYYWKVKDPLAKYMQVFTGPKLGIRYKGLALNLKAIDEVTAFFDQVDTYYSSIIADEVALGIVYDLSGVKEVPFIVGARHFAHKSYPAVKPDKNLHKCIYAKALFKLYGRFNYKLPQLRYLISQLLHCH